MAGWGAWPGVSRSRAGRHGAAAATVLVLAAGACVAVQVVAPLPASAVSSHPTTIAAGFTHSCAIRGGKAYCWGSNGSGQLGNNTTISSNVPVPVSTSGVLSGVTLTQITTGDNFTCALGAAGAAYCWGLNSHGEMGNNTVTAAQDTPVAVTMSGLTFTQLSAGNAAMCALTSTALAYCWGLGTSGQLGNSGLVDSRVPVAVTATTGTPLFGLTMTQIAAGKTFACALASTGAAYCWGAGAAGQLGNGTTTATQSTPVAVTASGALVGLTLTQITAGSGTACALASTGAAYCWGAGAAGQLGNGTTTATQTTAVAVDTSGALVGVTLTQITEGNDLTCALGSTGAAYCWGAGGSGQLGNGTTTQSLVPVAVSTSGVLSGKTLTQISAGGFNQTCALDSAGTAYCWGVNTAGQLGNTDIAANFLVPVAVAPPQATTIAAGQAHSCEILSGNAYCWGDNTNGELGNNTTISSNVPVAVYTGGVLSGVDLTQITAGTNFTCALDAAGAAYCWGLGTSGQLGNGTTTSSSIPVLVTTSGALSGVTLTQITADGATTCALASAGTAYCWGAGGSGQLGNGTTTAAQSTAVPVSGGLTLTQITAGGTSVCALSSAGTAYCWGAGGSGQLGNTTNTAAQSTPVAVTTTGVLAAVTLTEITAGGSTACALSSAGLAYCWGLGTNGQLGNTSTTSSNVPVTVTATGVLSGVALSQITEGSNSTCVLSTAGVAYCWGGGAIGQLGNGSTTASQTTAVAVTATGVLTGQTLTQITAGTTFVCALDDMGAAYCWGENASGQLGDPDTAVNFLVPVTVTSQATMIAAGGTHSCLLRHGKAYCWGDNSFGELGINSASPTQSLVPLAVYTGGVLSGKTLIQISANVDWTCALASTGAAYCWGDNSSGSGDLTALGNGGSTASNAPVLVSNSGTTLIFTQISVGSDFACALTSAGVAYCWGNNHNGQVGNSGTSLASTPQAVTVSGALSGLTLTQIAAGGNVALGDFTCAQASTGAAFCWGFGTSGELGNSANLTTSAPVAVTASGVLSGVALTQVATGGNSSCALGTGGATYCWGLGTSGQLGNNLGTTSNAPVAVLATGVLSGVALAQVTGGNSFACALGTAGAASCWGLGTSGQLGNSASATSNAPVAVTVSGVLAGVTLAQISSGTAHTCTEDSTGAFYCWGDNTNGDLGNNSTTLSNVPVIVQGIVPGAPTSVTAFPANASAAVYWVAPASLGTGTLTGYTATASPGGASCSTVSAVTCTITGLTNGTTYTVTVVTLTTDGNSAPSTAATVTPWPPGIIAVGKSHSCTIFSGKAYCWGDNTNGELGNNTSSGTAQATPVAVDTTGVLSGKTLTQISAGQNFTCALDSTGHAYCWGLNSTGQLGNNNLGVDSHVPVAVSTAGVLSGKTLTQISVGLAFACALDSAGLAYCWGAGQEGELGNNTVLTNSGVPVAVTTAATAIAGKTLTQISAGYDHACVLDTAGVAYCWGYNGNGGLGNNSTTQSPVAVIAAGALTGKVITQISAGNKFSCALDSTGLAYCWGYNATGQLGINSTSQSLVPVAVTTAATAIAGKTLTQISVTANDHSCALDATGVAYCWGNNNHGQLGNNSTTESNVAVAVTTAATPMSGMTITQISSGYAHTCTMDATGTAYCWGLGSSGQLGNNSTSQSLVPGFVGPQGPTGVAATPGDATAAISWTAPVFLNNGTITGYAAAASPGVASCSTTTATLCTISGLTDGTTYTITVTVTATTGTASGATVTVVPAGFLTLTSPSSLTWAATENGVNQSVADTVSADQQLTATDNTSTGAGWHITISATTFTSGANSLPNTGAVNFTGSVSSITSSAPSVACVGSCTLPTNTATYPVVINTAVSSPAAFTIYDTSAATGLGVMTIGGSAAANPAGWWVKVPASARAGSYTSTVTLTMVSGP